MGKFENKTVVVTGGNSGIGLAAVKGFLREGANVVFSGRRQEALDEVSEGLSLSVRLCSLYWHYLLLVWLIMFGLLLST